MNNRELKQTRRRVSNFFGEKYWELIKIYTLPIMHYGRVHFLILPYNMIYITQVEKIAPKTTLSVAIN